MHFEFNLEIEHIVIIVLLMAILYVFLYKKESFHGGNNCIGLSKDECVNNSECGYCVDDTGAGTCMAGNPASPYFSDRCLNWTQKNPELKKEHNCGNFYPYDTRTRQHQKYAKNTII